MTLTKQMYSTKSNLQNTQKPHQTTKSDDLNRLQTLNQHLTYKMTVAFVWRGYQHQNVIFVLNDPTTMSREIFRGRKQDSKNKTRGTELLKGFND